MKLIFTALAFFLSLSIYAQQGSVQAINDYFNGHPNERVYLHLDNNLYSPDDTVWFKGYVTTNGLLSSYSKNLYVDWYNASGKLLQHQTYPVVNGATYGQFVIPHSLAGNTIEVLAYTHWMLNDDTAFLFHKSIPLLEAKATKLLKQKQKNKRPFYSSFLKAAI